MKRIATILSILAVMLATLSAAPDQPLVEHVWIAPFNTSVIDMASDMFKPLKDGGYWDTNHKTGRPGEGLYNDDTMLAVVGVAESTEEKEVTFTFNSANPWKYTSASNNSFYRPFGISLSLTGAWSISNHQVSNHDKNIQTVHLGYANTTQLNTLEYTMTLPNTDGTENNLTNVKYYGAWIDVVLVLPGTVNSDGFIDLNGNGVAEENELAYCRLAAVDDYYTSFTVTIRGKETNRVDASHTFILNGYYEKEPENSSTSVSLVLNRLPAASNIDIARLEDSPLEIADYSFSVSSSYKTDKNDANWTERDYYFSLSSDNTGSDLFALKLVGTEGASLNQQNSINYVVGLKSDYDTASLPIYWFDGRNGIGASGNTIVQSFPHAQERVETIAPKDRNQRVFSFYDEGKIMIKLPENADISHLLAGRYRSSIYFNVISNK